MGSIEFRSKIDSWLAAIIIAAIVIDLAAIAAVVLSTSAKMALIVVPIVLLGAALPLWLLVSTRYLLDADNLVVRSGPFRWHVPIREISDVTPTRSPLASPALSLDRLRIDYGDTRSVLISPADQQRFRAEIGRRRAASAHERAG
jgi:membrane protein YdbS with pleckstrin-like domain